MRHEIILGCDVQPTVKEWLIFQSGLIDCMKFIISWFLGHVIYEMSAGRALEQEVPTDSDCAAVKGNVDGVRAVLSFIFSMSDSVASGAMSYKEGLQRVGSDWSASGHVTWVLLSPLQVKGHNFFITSDQTRVDLDFSSTEVGKDTHQTPVAICTIDKSSVLGGYHCTRQWWCRHTQPLYKWHFCSFLHIDAIVCQFYALLRPYDWKFWKPWMFPNSCRHLAVILPHVAFFVVTCRAQFLEYRRLQNL